MGKCCSKNLEKEPEYIPLNVGSVHKERSFSGDYEVPMKVAGLPSDKNVEENNSFDTTLKEDELLLKAKGDQLISIERVSTVKDFLIGKYFDEQIDIWFRTIYVMDTDSVRKQFLSLHGLDMRKMDKDIFESWCEENGYFETKLCFDRFLLLDYMPQNRILLGLTHKYEVKIHMSDVFTFKGQGPYRAVTCYGRQSQLVDRALNEYENRLGKRVTVPTLAKHWDNNCFPDPIYDIADRPLDYPFKWPRRQKHLPPYTPRWPYKINKSCPVALRIKVGDAFLQPRMNDQRNNVNESKLDNREIKIVEDTSTIVSKNLI